MVPGRGALEDTSATCSGIDVMTTTTLNYTDDDNFNTRFSTVIRLPIVSIVTFWRNCSVGAAESMGNYWTEEDVHMEISCLLPTLVENSDIVVPSAQELLSGSIKFYGKATFASVAPGLGQGGDVRKYCGSWSRVRPFVEISYMHLEYYSAMQLCYFNHYFSSLAALSGSLHHSHCFLLIASPSTLVLPNASKRN